MTSIPIQRDMKIFHKEVQEIEALKTHQSNELQRMKKRLLEAMKNYQDLSAQYIARSGYFQRMTTSNARMYMQLPFMKDQGMDIYEKVFEINDIPSYRTMLPKFMKAFYKCLNDMPAFFAKLSTNKHFGNHPFLPEGVKLSDFIACSTFPSLFGHLYTNELKQCYIKFLVEIAKNLSPDVFDNFREHWLFDCLKSYIHASDIRVFLKKSLESIIIRVIRDESLVNLLKTRNNQELFNKIADIITEMLNHLQSNFAIFPQDVRYLLHEFSALAIDEDMKVKRLEIILLDSIIIPAISIPKSYGVLPSSYYYDSSPLGPSRILQLIAQCFRYILHPQSAADRYQGVDVSCLTKIPFHDFIMSLPSKECKLAGCRLQDFINNLNIHFAMTLFAVPDVIALSYLVRQMSLGTSRPHQELTRSAGDLPIGEPVPYVFFRFEHWTLGDFAAESPQFPENKVRIDDSQESNTANSLYQLLSYLPYKEVAPSELNEWMVYHMNDCLLNRDYKKFTYLQHYINLSEGSNDAAKINPGLEEVIRRVMAYTQINSNLIELCAAQVTSTEHEIEKIKAKTEIWIPIYNDVLLQGFLGQNVTIQNEINDMVNNEMAFEKHIFESFLQEKLKKLKTYIADKNLPQDTYRNVAILFHAWILSSIPFEKFMKKNHGLEKIDAKIKQSNKDMIINKTKAPPKIMKLFEFPPLFTFAIQEVQSAVNAENPVVAIQYFASSIELLKRIFLLEIGGLPQADDVLPLFAFTFLHSGVDNIFSFLKYVFTYMWIYFDDTLKYYPDDVQQSLVTLESCVSMFNAVIPQL